MDYYVTSGSKVSHSGSSSEFQHVPVPNRFDQVLKKDFLSKVWRKFKQLSEKRRLKQNYASFPTIAQLWQPAPVHLPHTHKRTHAVS